jgi:hypothetical protein
VRWAWDSKRSIGEMLWHAQTLARYFPSPKILGKAVFFAPINFSQRPERDAARYPPWSRWVGGWGPPNDESFPPFHNLCVCTLAALNSAPRRWFDPALLSRSKLTHICIEYINDEALK